MSDKKQGAQGMASRMPTSFGILAGMLVVLALITVGIAAAGVADVTGATLPTVIMAPVKGFSDAVSVCLFVMVLGGFLGVVTATGALDAGVATLVHKLKSNEIMLIPILMLLFSIGGTTFGMGEETVPFYFLLAATMVAAGFDAMVGASMVLLGAGSGVLGSTINPFATGSAIDSLSGTGIEVNQGISSVRAWCCGSPPSASPSSSSCPTPSASRPIRAVPS